MKLTIGDYASYLKFDNDAEFVDTTKEIADGVYADYDVHGNIMGIEFTCSIKLAAYSDNTKEITIEKEDEAN
jgi:uncharacterized protein YuzE